MRSYGVKKCRRPAVPCLGPSSGNTARVAALVEADSCVTPVRRVEKKYEPATLIGPRTCLTSTREVLLTTCATSKCWTDQARMCLELRQRKVAPSPRLSGSRLSSDGSGSGL